MSANAFKSWTSSHSESAGQQLQDPKSWASFRRKAFASFAEKPFPPFKYGLDIRSDVSRLDWEKFFFDATPAKPFMQELGNGAVMCDFATAFREFPEEMDEYLGKQLRLSEKMEALHAAFLSSGVFIYLPAGVQLSKTIHVSSVLEKHSRIGHVLVVAEANSSASILQELKSEFPHLHEPVFDSSVLEIVAKENASIRVGRLQDFSPSNVFHHSIFRADVAANALVHMEWAEFGGEWVKSEYASSLLQSQAASSNVGVVLAAHAQQLDVHQAVRHVSPHTRSELLMRGCLDESAKCIYNGLIRMEKEAVVSQGKQACDLLLLSPLAEADPVPSLEILNSDVKCSHAATVGRLDKEKLFYIASRGVSEEVARSMVIAGFYENILAHFSMPELKAKCQSLLEGRLKLNTHTFETIERDSTQGVNA
ncbi:MAG: SufD family Fe-S cluster assembly protein [Candidatus Iainarchaeum archaeon]|uniref:SufD family Fe-S cluster assembly protein n=1 Tax=Candidatus Iainarchaeum sp. TaxID=3101447 RepID=A0A7T9DK69_9ARCH|nr:MAG: SufD family Fe-S cluster assembly protein [Candidatus Diapherotrites archaeon]